MKVRSKIFSFLIFMILITGAVSVSAQSGGILEAPDGSISISSTLELGFLGFFSHKIQSGTTGTYFDYVEEGGQDVLFPFQRISADIKFGSRHTVIFLVQPFNILTDILLQNDLIVDGKIFTAETPMNLRYGFDFYRVSYLYDFWKEPEKELAAGLSLQLRDAVIDFASADGTQFIGNRNVGPVPILKFRFNYPLGPLFFVGSEIDGFYVSLKVLNGSLTSEVTGLILDASLRAGIRPSRFFDAFLNLRYVGGGAEGTSENSTPPGDGFTKNYFQAFSVSLGGRIH